MAFIILYQKNIGALKKRENKTSLQEKRSIYSSGVIQHQMDSIRIDYEYNLGLLLCLI